MSASVIAPKREATKEETKETKDDVTGTLKLTSKVSRVYVVRVSVERPPIMLCVCVCVVQDKKEYEVERKHAFVSTLVKTSLDTGQIALSFFFPFNAFELGGVWTYVDLTATEVPIPGVSSAILAEVITYINHHKGVEPPIVEKPLRSKVMKDVCKDPFDADFIDRIGENRQALYDVILAANYMDIKSLLHLGCAKIASLIKGQPLEKIKDILSTGVKTSPPLPESKGAATAPSASSTTTPSVASSLATATSDTAAAAAADEPLSSSVPSSSSPGDVASVSISSAA